MCGPIIREMRDWSDDVSKGSVRFFFAPVFKRQNRDRFFGNCRCLLHCPPWACSPPFSCARTRQGNFYGCSIRFRRWNCATSTISGTTLRNRSRRIMKWLTAASCYAAAAILVKPKRRLDINAEDKSQLGYDTKYTSKATRTATDTGTALT